MTPPADHSLRAILDGGYVATRSEIAVALRPVAIPAFAAVVSLRGEHDLASVTELDEVLASISGPVLVDLSECLFIDCSVIGALVRASRAAAREDHRLELVLPAVDTIVTRIAEIVRLRELISVIDRRPDAGVRPRSDGVNVSRGVIG